MGETEVFVWVNQRYVYVFGMGETSAVLCVDEDIVKGRGAGRGGSFASARGPVPVPVVAAAAGAGLVCGFVVCEPPGAQAQVQAHAWVVGGVLGSGV